MEDTVVPIVIMTLLVGGPIAAWIVSRVLAHNEYMAMLRMGIVPPPDSKAARRAARAGWMPPPYPFGTAGQQPSAQDPYAPYGGYMNYYAQRQLHRGISVALIGLALLIAMGMIGRGGFAFGPQLLPGLVVTFVGLAQIINGVLGGARVGGGIPYQQQQQQQPGSQSPFGQQQPGNGNFGPPPSAPTGGSPYGWRPGNVPEIEKPAQPPDQR